jgi:hypothetical protein
MAAIAPLKTPRDVAEPSAGACEAFEHKPAARVMGARRYSLRATGKRARGTQAIDVPRTPGSPVTPFRAEHPAQRAANRCAGTTRKETR